MKLTFVDAGVLIAGARGGSEQAKPTRSIHRARAVKVVTIHPEPRLGGLYPALIALRRADTALWQG